MWYVHPHAHVHVHVLFTCVFHTSQLGCSSGPWRGHWWTHWLRTPCSYEWNSCRPWSRRWVCSHAVVGGGRRRRRGQKCTSGCCRRDRLWRNGIGPGRDSGWRSCCFSCDWWASQLPHPRQDDLYCPESHLEGEMNSDFNLLLTE